MLHLPVSNSINVIKGRVVKMFYHVNISRFLLLPWNAEIVALAIVMLQRGLLGLPLELERANHLNKMKQEQR
jgi:hypothetical protein